MNKVFLIFNNVCSLIVSIFGFATIGTTLNLYNNYNLAKNEYDFYHLYNQSNDKNLIKDDLDKLINLKYKNPINDSYYLTLTEIESKTTNTLKDFLNFLKDKQNPNSIIFNEKVNSDIQNNLNTDFFNALNNFEQTINSLKEKDENFYYQSLEFCATVSQNYSYNAVPENISFIAGLCLTLIGITWFMVYWSIFLFKKLKKNEK